MNLKISVANFMGMLLTVHAENVLHIGIGLDSKLAGTARLLGWNVAVLFQILEYIFGQGTSPLLSTDEFMSFLQSLVMLGLADILLHKFISLAMLLLL
jgi:hypothetical protein